MAWEDTPVTQLDISPGFAANLKATGLETAGQLVTWIDSGKKVSDIKGLGDENSTAVRILTIAICDFMAHHVPTWTFPGPPIADAIDEPEEDELDDMADVMGQEQTFDPETGMPTNTLDDLDDGEVIDPAFEVVEDDKPAQPGQGHAPGPNIKDDDEDDQAADEERAAQIREGVADAHARMLAAPDHVQRKHYSEIIELGAHVSILEAIHIDAKRVERKAKKDVDEGHAQLTALIARGPDPQQELFSEDGSANKPKTTTPAVEAVAQATRGEISDDPERDQAEYDKSPSRVQPDDDAWRNATLEPLKLTKHQAELFAQAGITNLGEFEDARANGEFRQIKGLGGARGDAIEERALQMLATITGGVAPGADKPEPAQDAGSAPAAENEDSYAEEEQATEEEAARRDELNRQLDEEMAREQETNGAAVALTWALLDERGMLPTEIELISPLAGSDNDKDGAVTGARFMVEGCVGRAVVLQSKRGKQMLAQEQEYKIVNAVVPQAE